MPFCETNFVSLEECGCSKQYCLKKRSRFCFEIHIYLTVSAEGNLDCSVVSLKNVHNYFNDFGLTQERRASSSDRIISLHVH